MLFPTPGLCNVLTLAWYQQTVNDGREIVQVVESKLEWLLLALALDLLKLS